LDIFVCLNLGTQNSKRETNTLTTNTCQCSEANDSPDTLNNGFAKLYSKVPNMLTGSPASIAWFCRTPSLWVRRFWNHLVQKEL